MARFRLALAALLVSSPAAAGQAPPLLHLKWTDRADCPPSKRIEKKVAALVSPSAKAVPPVSAELALKRTGKGYRVRLVTEQLGERGERDFDARTCDDAEDAVALVLGVMLSPSETTETVKHRGFPGGVRPRPRRAPPPPPPSRPRAPARVAPQRIRFGIGPRAGFDEGALPAPTAFVGLGAWVGSGAWRASARGAVWIPRMATRGPRKGSGADIGLVAGSAGGCFAPLRRALVVEGCLGFEGGSFTAQGLGIRNPRRVHMPWFALLPGLSIRAPAGALGAVVSLEAPIALLRPAFTIDRFGEVFRVAPVGFRASIGADWVLP